MKQHAIFLFASFYKSKNPKIASPESFSLSDQDFAGFQTWLGQQKINYESPVEKQIKQSLELAKKDPAYAQLEASLQQLKPEWTSSMQKELVAHKKEIVALREQEII